MARLPHEGREEKKIDYSQGDKYAKYSGNTMRGARLVTNVECC